MESLFTGSSDSAHADEMVSKVRDNHDSITVDGNEITVETHIGAFIGFPDRVSAKNVFDEIAKNIDEIHNL